MRGRPGVWLYMVPPHTQLPPHRAQKGLKAMFPRRSYWSQSRPQSAPFTAVPAQSPEHLRVWSEGNHLVSITCQEGSQINASLFPEKLHAHSKGLGQTCSFFPSSQPPVGSW